MAFWLQFELAVTIASAIGMAYSALKYLYNNLCTKFKPQPDPCDDFDITECFYSDSPMMIFPSASAFNFEIEIPQDNVMSWQDLTLTGRQLAEAIKER
jgi:hypothetical protein